jgi:hypothetical protein
MPYDEFARLQLAGDVLRPQDAEAIEATGFLVAGAYDTAGQSQQSVAMRMVVRQDELEDLVGTIGQTFLGLTINCARCHDHKFDPIKQVEYYRLTAALGGVRQGERDLTHLDRRVVETHRRIAELKAQSATLEEPVRARILAQRQQSPEAAPRPLARWDFAGDLRDRLGGLHGGTRGNARLVSSGLKVDGKLSYVVTVPLATDLKAKTLEAWVSLDNLQQRGGGVVSVQTLNGSQFDAIVFGERDPGQWMAGSENFRRTQPLGGPAETEVGKPIHIAVVYGEDGVITAYRNGQPYGQPYRSGAPVTFKAGQTEVLFGLRHSPAEGNRLLAGLLHRVQLYDRALSPAEVARSSNYISSEELTAHLSAEQRAQREALRAKIMELEDSLPRAPRNVHAITPRQAETAYLLVRGNPQQKGEVVSAGGVGALKGVQANFGLAHDAPEAERRRLLAAWITDPANPLFARVMVNRLWQHHFGAGLVDTPNDFGFNGGRPSHPELLDWLAAEFIERRWGLKQLHRTLVTSATYRQGSRPNEVASQLDADNRLLWRRSPQRLEAETVRDAVLSVAGQLNPRLGGPGFQDFRLTRAPGTAAILYLPADMTGEEINRRTLYRTWARGGRNGLLDAFDCPDPSTTTPRRPVTTTPLQALAMLNNLFVLRMADHFANRLVHEAGPSVDGQITRAYRLAYGRVPQVEELALARKVVSQHGLAVLARALFNSNEFLYVD